MPQAQILSASQPHAAENIHARPVSWTVELHYAPAKPSPPDWLISSVAAREKLRTAYRQCRSDSMEGLRLFSEHGSGRRSECTITASRLVIHEKDTNLRVEDLVAKLNLTANVVMDALHVEAFERQVAAFQVALEPEHASSGLAYVQEHILSHKAGVGGFFQRPLTRSTVQLLFSESVNHRGSFQLTVSSSVDQRHTVLVEAKGVFLQEHIERRSLRRIHRNIQSVHEFMNERALPFVKHFDHYRSR